jgi:hypothetical protein
MNSTDKLAILTEESYQEIIPSEVLRDPVDKLRVSQPQSLIDTDFEYGVQSTKWESINLLNNRPSAFYDPTQSISNVSANSVFFNSVGVYQITNVTSSGRTVTVTINNTTGIVANTPVFIQGTLDQANVDGWWIVEGVAPNTNFTFTVTNTPTTASLFVRLKIWTLWVFTPETRSRWHLHKLLLTRNTKSCATPVWLFCVRLVWTQAAPTYSFPSTPSMAAWW